MSYQINIIKAAAENKNFRTVLYTGKRSQLVVMNISVGEDIGEEMHEHVEQILYFQSGSGKVVIDGKESVVGAGDIVIVSPGATHNVINAGSDPLIIATIYVPPNHIDGRVHATKNDAINDDADEAFGESTAT